MRALTDTIFLAKPNFLAGSLFHEVDNAAEMTEEQVSRYYDQICSGFINYSMSTEKVRLVFKGRDIIGLDLSKLWTATRQKKVLGLTFCTLSDDMIGCYYGVSHENSIRIDCPSYYKMINGNYTYLPKDAKEVKEYKNLEHAFQNLQFV